ncbi:MAG: GMC family oxidoreductase [Sphingomonadaceae bacterium]|nr:GMC family oxidoreductase [Sphingomonadaceae bacterium]
MSGTKAPDKVDVVIVGAGAAGSLYAAKLAGAGKSVVVLEAGPPWTAADLTSSQIWARRLKWGGPNVDFQGDHHSFPHNLNTGWGFGGSALHHYATWPRMPRDSFKLRGLHGMGRDWPFDYDELRPWYDQIQKDVGISGDATKEHWRPPGDAYPMPGMKTFGQGRILARGFEKLGLPVAPLPAAINTKWYNNRPPCQYDGWCDAGCPILALANPFATYFPQAQAAGAKLQSRATVLRIVPGAKARAAGVEYADEKGRRIIQHADVVVLAASGVQNPRLLLNSAAAEWPKGAGNDTDQVGRNFMLDGVALTYGLFAEETEPHMGVSAGQLMHRALYGERPGAPFGSYQWQIAPAMKPNDIFGIAISRGDLIGQPLHDFIRRASRHIANSVAMIEQLANPDNRVTLSGDNDAFGMPKAKILHNFGTQMPTMWRHCIDEGLAVMQAAGALEKWSAPMVSGHLGGGTIMGADPVDSVTDAYGRVHGIANIVIGGSGLFPSTGGTSPTFSLMAVALRSVEHMLGHWSDYAAA